MNNMSVKEKALAGVAMMVVLYALAAGLWFLAQQKAWQKANRDYAKACKTYNDECRLISQSNRWRDEYEREKAKMPTFREGQSSATTWLSAMDEIAQTNYVHIADRQAGKEEVVGEVTELPIDVKNWDGALESLVRFVYSLEHTDKGMFDIRELNVKPVKGGFLKGSFTLNCAYMKGE